MTQQLWFETAYTGNRIDHGVLFTLASDGTVAGTIAGVLDPPADAQSFHGLALSGAGTAQSHSLQRLLTSGALDPESRDDCIEHCERLQRALTPELCYSATRAAFTELISAGYTAVGEYLMSRHDSDFAMEDAVVRAALDAGIRLVLLDVYRTQAHSQSPQDFVTRHSLLDEHLTREFPDSYVPFRGHGSLPGSRASTSGGRITLGTALLVEPGFDEHDLRAFRTVAGTLHVHCSQEVSPELTSALTRMLADEGLLSARLTVVHATGLSERDIADLGRAQVSAVVSPSSPRPRGIEHVPAFVQAGVRLAVGTDWTAAHDPFLEMRELDRATRDDDGGRRLRTSALIRALTRGGPHAVGLGTGMALAGPADFAVLRYPAGTSSSDSIDRIIALARASELAHVIVGGREIVRNGQHLTLTSAHEQLAAVKRDFGLAGPV